MSRPRSKSQNRTQDKLSDPLKFVAEWMGIYEHRIHSIVLLILFLFVLSLYNDFISDGYLANKQKSLQRATNELVRFSGQLPQLSTTYLKVINELRIQQAPSGVDLPFLANGLLFVLEHKLKDSLRSIRDTKYSGNLTAMLNGTKRLQQDVVGFQSILDQFVSWESRLTEAHSRTIFSDYEEAELEAKVKANRDTQNGTALDVQSGDRLRNIIIDAECPIWNVSALVQLNELLLRKAELENTPVDYDLARMAALLVPDLPNGRRINEVDPFSAYIPPYVASRDRQAVLGLTKVRMREIVNEVNPQFEVHLRDDVDQLLQKARTELEQVNSRISSREVQIPLLDVRMDRVVLKVGIPLLFAFLMHLLASYVQVFADTAAYLRESQFYQEGEGIAWQGPWMVMFALRSNFYPAKQEGGIRIGTIIANGVSILMRVVFAGVIPLIILGVPLMSNLLRLFWSEGPDNAATYVLVSSSLLLSSLSVFVDTQRTLRAIPILIHPMKEGL